MVLHETPTLCLSLFYVLVVQREHGGTRDTDASMTREDVVVQILLNSRKWVVL